MMLWILGGALAIFLSALGFWWKIESQQNGAIKDLAKSNNVEHADILKQMNEQHMNLRDKIEKIWQKLPEK